MFDVLYINLCTALHIVVQYEFRQIRASKMFRLTKQFRDCHYVDLMMWLANFLRHVTRK